MNVIKRDGTIQTFDFIKVINAVTRAFDSVGQKVPEKFLEQLKESVEKRIIKNNGNGTPIEEIQDVIQKELIRRNKYDVVESFINYRHKREEIRAQKFMLMSQIAQKNHEVNEKMQFLTDYCDASNAATGSKYDANANVENKNIATLIGELPKSNFIALNRQLLVDRIKELYDEDLAERYLELLNKHFIYKNDETSLANYCASITMYPWLINGTCEIGGNSTAPTNLKSFCGGFINMVFMVSSMLSGACATPEFLMYLNYFIGLEYGKDYYMHVDKVVDLSIKQRTIDKIITDCFEQIVYSINQPTGARNFQAVFWNIAYYDKAYFDSLFGEFYFPDGSKPDWNGLCWLQKRFMKWFNKERTKTLLTFPVETMALLSKDGEMVDSDMADFTAEMYADGHSFFTYMSDNADSLSSCCRLRNEIQDNGFSYTLGAGGVSTGSKSVLTINLNRCVQYAINNDIDYVEFISEITDLCHKVQIAYNENLKDLQKHGMLPLFDAGYININRQYLTIGINGLVESAEFLGIPIKDIKEYRDYVQKILGIIEKKNKEYRTKELMFNCEMIPAENVGVKHAKWDKEDGYVVNRDCYNSYFYIVEDDSLDIIDKFKLHGREYIEHLTGGSALHMNLEEHLSKEQYAQLLKVAAKTGCNYFTFNIPNTVCNDCGHIDKRYLHECPHCQSKNIDYLTRVIGYLKRVSNFSAPRQEEASRRFYYNGSTNNLA